MYKIYNHHHPEDHHPQLQKALPKEQQISPQKKPISGHDFHCKWNVTRAVRAACGRAVISQPSLLTPSFSLKAA